MIPFNWQQYRLSVGITAFDVKTNRDQMPSGTFSHSLQSVLTASPHKRNLPSFTTFFPLFNPTRLSLFFFLFFLVLFSAKDEKKKLIQNNSVTWALRNLEVNTFQLAFIYFLNSYGKENKRWGCKERIITKQNHRTFWKKWWMMKNQKLLSFSKKLKCACYVSRRPVTAKE